MPFSDLLSADRIVMVVAPGSRDVVLDSAARLLAGNSPTLTPLLAHALRDREQLGSTGIGHGVAIPHARSTAFREPRAAFLRLSHPVDFNGADGQPVDLVFAMCVPDQQVEQHLQTLAGLVERFADAGFRDAVRHARDLSQLRGLLLDPAAPAAGAAP
ncbi:PTS fructose transporter subunit IIA [Luteimonas chenhongjianii]|uniref:PTS fructose transporter subunit IIA n=1 Tax=Luteimonas chenhongjianii TaxID=2006110 RepID=A0A290XH82_9GAMM|nr:PTS sugar transporter subunit IIA [Luteimonas chenhongjianii]ATD68296.1 PTS fructose transporter subunit IIA [Luteimonas chenhongjianii]